MLVAFAAVAFGGDVKVNNTLVLWPSAHGNLDLLAAGSVQLVNAPILVSDVDPGSLPSANPTITATGPADQFSADAQDCSPSSTSPRTS